MPWQAWMLACALLLAQALGLAHRVHHAPGGAQWLQAAAHRSAPEACAEHGQAHAVTAAHSPHTALHAADHTAEHKADHKADHKAQHKPEHAHGLAGHEAGDAECRLVDQVAQGDALCTAPAPAPAPVLLPAPVPAPAAQRLAQPLRAAYQARAPPLA